MPRKFIRITSAPEMHEGKKEWTFRFKIPAMNGKPATWDDMQKTGTKREREARRIAEDYRRELEERINAWESWEHITLAQYARNWHDKRMGEVALSTWKKDNQQIKQIEASTLGAIRLDEIEPEDIERQLKENKKAGFSSDKNARFLKKVKVIMKTAAERQTIRRDPAALVKNVKVRSVERKAVPSLDIARMLEWIMSGEKTSYTTALLIAIETGMRRGEILGLQWGDVTLSGKGGRAYINVRRQYTTNGELTPPKWESYGTVPMTKELRKWLFDWSAESTGMRGWASPKPGSKLYFRPVCVSANGGYIDPNNFDRWMRKLCKRFKWGQSDENGKWHPYTMHQIRHYVATTLLANGVDLQTVKTIMRHKNISTTEKYVHEIPENVKRAMDSIEDSQKLSLGALEYLLVTEGI